MSDKSFEGNVEVYNETYYINTKTGEGIDKVLKKIDPLLCKMASHTYMNGYNFDDLKQELTILAIEGMSAYDSSKNTRLSTFLHRHLFNKIISKIKSKNKLSSDAFYLHEDELETCDCGGKITGFLNKKICEDCGTTYNNKLRRARPELNFTQCAPRMENGEEMLFIDSLTEGDGLYINADSTEQMPFDLSLKEISSKIDPKTLKIIKLICYKDYSIKDAAQKVGLSGWAASMRLKKLIKKKYFRDILGNAGFGYLQDNL